jgi:hypothetical protein
MAQSQHRNRVLFVAGVLALFGLLNALPTGSWVPVGIGPAAMHRFGFGFPLKWAYDPEYRHTGKKRDQHAVSAVGNWRSDGAAAGIDLAVGGVMAAIALGYRLLLRKATGA